MCFLKHFFSIQSYEYLKLSVSSHGRTILMLLSLALVVISTGCAQQHRGVFSDDNCTTYSECFQPFKHDLENGHNSKICQKFNAIDAEMKQKHQYDDNFAESMGMLNLLEISSLYLQTESIDKSLEYSRYAECLVEKRNNDSMLWDTLRKGTSIVTTLTGGNEYSVYDPVGYEKVLLLNIQAMAYLLKGDDRAYNVARKSTEWQDEEHERFDEQIQSIKQQHNNGEEEEGNPKEKKQKWEIKNKVFKALAKEYAKYNRTALKVPSSFVNPFGDYLSGTVKEFRSEDYNHGSEKDNARIHYKKALELNPASRVLKLSLQDMKKRRSAARLIQLVAFDGFVPEKNIFKFDVHLKKCPIPIHLEVPMYNPVKTKVHKIVASTTGGRNLATFRPVANIEALALRHQKEMLPAVQTLVAIAAVRDYFITSVTQSLSETVNKKFSNNANLKKSINKLIGGLLGAFDRNLEPDTSTWMSLPKRILAARFHPPRNLKTIVITSYDAKGRKLARKKIKLDKGVRHFIFVRTLNNQMKVIPGKKIWSPKEKIKKIDC